MSSDGYLFFTQTHRVYVQGVRQAIKDRLLAAYGENWWERGVTNALQGTLLKSLQTVVEKNPTHNRELFIETSHVGWIIVKNHNEAFSDAFGDTVRTWTDLRRLNDLRNEWAHIHDVSPARAVQAAELMKSILASLRREEALEIERMSHDFVLDPVDRGGENSVEYPDHPEPVSNGQDSLMSSLAFWSQLQSYLVFEKKVEMPEDSRSGEARLIVKVHNTAPNSSDWPAVYFKSVIVTASGATNRRYGGNTHEIKNLSPGESQELEFTFPSRLLASLEFQVSSAIDEQKLWEFHRSTGLPPEIVLPIREEFGKELAEIGVREFVSKVLDEISTLDSDSKMTEIARVREHIRQQPTLFEEKQNSLRNLYRDFSLNGESSLGASTGEIMQTLTELRNKLSALDEAIGQTDMQLISEAVYDLKQVQLAVLRLEDAIRTMTKPIPRWDVHFGILKTTEGTPRLLILLLGTDRVATAGRFSDMYISPWL